MKVLTEKLSSIAPYQNNPRRNANAVSAVAASLKEFGWKQPIVVDKNRVIIVGHTRYLGALSLGWTEGPIHVASDLTDAQVIAYRLADNKVGEIATWDDAKLFEELEAIAESGFDLSGMGFTEDEMNSVITLKKADERYLEDFEVIPKPKPKWILISAAEDECAVILSALKNLNLDTAKIEFSGEPSIS